MFNLLSTYLVDEIEPYVKWISIGLLALVALVAVASYFSKNETLTKYLKVFALSFFVYALVVGIVMLSLDIYKHFNSAYLEKNYVNKEVVYLVLIPVAVTLLFALISFGIIYFLKRKNLENLKKISYVLYSVCAIAFLTSLVLIAVYYAKHIDGDGYYTADGTNFSLVALYVSSVLLIAVLVLSAFFLGKDYSPLSSKEIARAGVSIATAFALSYVKLFSMPQGGSITLASMLPIILFAYTYGAKKGIFVGLIYGALQSLQSPYIIHPAQFLLDYPIAFASLGLAGLIKDVNGISDGAKFALGTIFGGVMRYISHVLSGAFAFGAYAGGKNVFTYSFSYNSYVLIDLVLVIAVGILLTQNKNFKKILKG